MSGKETCIFVPLNTCISVAQEDVSSCGTCLAVEQEDMRGANHVGVYLKSSIMLKLGKRLFLFVSEKGVSFPQKGAYGFEAPVVEVLQA